MKSLVQLVWLTFSDWLLYSLLMSLGDLCKKCIEMFYSSPFLLQVFLLDNRTSLKVNIFLKQFRLSHSEIVQILRDGRSNEIGAEKLRGLLKLLPQPEEVSLSALVRYVVLDRQQ